MTETEERSLKPKTESIEIEGQTKNQKNNRKRRCRCCCCAVITVTILLLLIIIGIILAFTVFKIKDPKTQLVSSTVTGIAPRVTLPAVRIELNITLDLELLVHNPNHVSFKHGRGTSQVFYLGNQVGEVDVSPGKIGSSGSETIKCKLTLEADQFASNMSRLISDVLNQELVLETKTRIPGRATILGFIKKHVVAFSNCQLSIQIPAMNVTNQVCSNKAKL